MEPGSTASTERPTAPGGGSARGRGFANLRGVTTERPAELGGRGERGHRHPNPWGVTDERLGAPGGGGACGRRFANLRGVTDERPAAPSGGGGGRGFANLWGVTGERPAAPSGCSGGRGQANLWGVVTDERASAPSGGSGGRGQAKLWSVTDERPAAPGGGSAGGRGQANLWSVTDERPAAPGGGGARDRGFANLWGVTVGPLRRVVIAALLAIGIYLAAALPITGREAYAFGHFVRPPLRDLLGGFDPADRVLNTLLMKRAVGLLRLSAFSLRVAGLAGLALYLWAVARLARGRWFAIALAGAAYLALEYCTPGEAVGLGLALWVCAMERAVAYLKGNQTDGLPNLNLVGFCLGLSVAANFCFLIPSLALAVALGFAARSFVSRETLWMERVVVTATVTAFLLLVLPFSHAGAGELARLIIPPPLRMARTPEDLSGLVAVLRHKSKGKTVRIAASADLVPVLEFYQARYREGRWRIVGFPSQAEYYVVDTRVVGIPGRTLYRGSTVALSQ